MKIEYQKDKAMLSDFDSFRISQTIECGQCFRFEKLAEEEYRIIALGRILHIKEEAGKILFYPVTKEEMEQVWIPYFDLEEDYTKIKKTLSERDSILAQAVAFAPGIRILKQDFFECLISFILSQNNRISKIKTAMKLISQKYGTFLETIDDQDYYAFPDCNALASATEEELMECKAGFRAKYILDAVKMVQQGILNAEELKAMDTEEARKKLLLVKGIGPKVADCILLFSLGKQEVFPTDVWIKKIMCHFYFQGEETPLKKIQQKAADIYGCYGGYAQQYLFHYSRELKIGMQEKKEELF